LLHGGSAQKRIASQGVVAEEDCFTGSAQKRTYLRGFFSRGLAQNGGLREEMESGIFRVSVQKREWISRRLP
jgi:hypothetical protein